MQFRSVTEKKKIPPKNFEILRQCKKKLEMVLSLTLEILKIQLISNIERRGEKNSNQL
uniref:Uncharacterized protein n=1 Tax=Octopus bimaculoides TaxID=37653 RepID=A0A0L8HTT8_OCTBM